MKFTTTKGRNARTYWQGYQLDLVVVSMNLAQLYMGAREDFHKVGQFDEPQ